MQINQTFHLLQTKSSINFVFGTWSSPNLFFPYERAGLKSFLCISKYFRQKIHVMRVFLFSIRLDENKPVA